MKRKPFYEQAPTPAEVRAAWAKARPGRDLYQRRFGFTQRGFFQGVVGEFLRQEAERANGSKLYRTRPRRFVRPTGHLRHRNAALRNAKALLAKGFQGADGQN